MPLLFNFDQRFTFAKRTLNPSRSRSSAMQRRGSSPGLKAPRMTMIKTDLRIADTRQATKLTDERSCPTRTDLARRVVDEYASDLRKIINKLRKKLN
jgi:hypothetical protein